MKQYTDLSKVFCKNNMFISAKHLPRDLRIMGVIALIFAAFAAFPFINNPSLLYLVQPVIYLCSAIILFSIASGVDRKEKWAWIVGTIAFSFTIIGTIISFALQQINLLYFIAGLLIPILFLTTFLKEKDKIIASKRVSVSLLSLCLIGFIVPISIIVANQFFYLSNLNLGSKKIEKREGFTIEKMDMIPKDQVGTLAHSKITFSPNGKRFAYRVKDNGKQFVILDGEKQKKYDEIWNLTFSPDDKHFAYWVKEGQKGFVVFDGEEQKKYDSAYNIHFSPDGNHLAYVVREDEKEFIVLDGEEQNRYENIISLVFGPNGKRFAYRAEDNGEQFVVLDGEKQKEYESVSSPAFSPDGEHFAYEAEENGKQFVVLDGEGRKKYKIITLDYFRSRFSPDGNHFFYRVKKGGKMFVVLDGEEQKKYDEIWNPTFSSDSQHFAYIAKEGDKEFIIIDGKKEKHFDSSSLNKFIFSPNGEDFAYIVTNSSKGKTVVVNGKPQGTYEIANDVLDLTFSPDGRHFAYVAEEGLCCEEFIVLDGKRQEVYYSVNNLFFSENNKVIYNALKKNNRGDLGIFRIEEVK